MTRNKQHPDQSARPSPSNLQAAPPPSHPSRFRVPWIAGLCALLAITTLAAYWGVQRHDFTFDDDSYIVGNTQIQDGLNAKSLRWAFTSTEEANWHPITWLSHIVDVQLFGLDAGKQHVTNLLLHMANAILLLLLLFRLTGALWRSAFVAALFALHPLHVESVAWIAERKDVLSTLFWLLTLFAWLAYVRSKKAGPYALTLALFALGLMAKPMLVTLPFTLLLLDFWPLHRLTLPLRGRSKEIKALLWEKAPLFAMAAASGVITFIAQRSGGAVQTLAGLPLSERAANAARGYVAYLGKTFWPSALAVYYPHLRAGLFAASTIAAIGALAVLTVVILRLGRKAAPYLSFGWLWYLGTLVPVIGLVQVGDQAMADRYTYMPLVGIFTAAVWGTADLARDNRVLRHAAMGMGLAVLAVLLILTRRQAAYWADEETLFGHTLAVTSNNWLAHTNYGLALYQKGRIKEALAHYKEAVRIDPDAFDAHNNLGVAYNNGGRVDEAIAQYHEALRIQPRSAVAFYNLGLALAKKNLWSEAITHYQKALQFKPDLPEARLNLGLALKHENRTSEALEQFEAARRLKPRASQVLNEMGMAYETMGSYPEAIAHYQAALKLKPDFAEALNNLGVALAKAGRTPEAIECLTKAATRYPELADAQSNLGNALKQAGRLEEAAAHYREALKVKPDFPEALNNLGLVLEKTGRYDEAIPYFSEAIRVNPDYADAQSNLGVALAMTGRNAEAIEHYRQALRIQPDSARTLDNLGLALGMMSRFPETLEQFRQAVLLNPDFAEAHCHLGIGLIQARRFEEAREQFQQALRINPGFEQARAGLAAAENALHGGR